MVNVNGAPDRIRTCDQRLRKPLLYPAELRVREGKMLRVLIHSFKGRGIAECLTVLTFKLFERIVRTFFTYLITIYLPRSHVDGVDWIYHI